jgi:protein-tyrosine-phosphatase
MDAPQPAGGLTPIRVLFVCSGNICRSPFAEAAARDRFGDRFDFSSAGTIAVEGGRATMTMQEVAAERGLDLSSHRARPLSEVPRPDLVFGMEQEHIVAAARAYPGLAPGSIRLLDHPRAIPDPYGFDLAVYRAAADHIESALDTLDLPS